jgi:serine/threonine-protein kinase
MEPEGVDGAELPPEIEAGLKAAYGRSGPTIRERSSVLMRLSARAGSPNPPGSTMSQTLRYRLVGEIAQGGIGVVNRCHDADLGREVAMKVLREDRLGDPEVLHRFVEEAQIGGQLEHPGIVPVYDLGLEDGRRPWFTMKLIQGRTLAALLEERVDPNADRQRFLQIFLQVCQTVAFAHSRGVIHRDLKPSNVMVGAFGEVQVVDWGLAKVLALTDRGGSHDSSNSKSPPEAATPPTPSHPVRTMRGRANAVDSETGSVMGTPAYMPPEQAQGDVDRLDERADVFALGAILCELLTGQPPYPGEKEQALLAAARAELGPALERLERSRVEIELLALCRDCLAPSRAGRPQDAKVVAARIGTFLARAQERAHEAQLAAAEAKGRLSQERKAKRLAIALGATIVAAVMLGGGATWWSNEQRRARVLRAERQISSGMSALSFLLGQAETAQDGVSWNAVVAAIDRIDALVAATGVATNQSANPQDDVLAARARAASAIRALEQEEKARRLTARLEEIRNGELECESGEDWHSIAEEYGRALRDFGIDLGSGSPDEAAAAVEEAGLVSAVVSVIDEWAAACNQFDDRERATRLSEIASLLDPDPVREQVRASIRSEDTAVLREIAKSPDLDRLSPANLVALERVLGAIRAHDERLHVLRTAQRLHPDDYLLTSNLGWVLVHPRTGRPQEGEAIMITAIALRPERAGPRHTLGFIC